MTHPDIIQFTPGAKIDQEKILEIRGLAAASSYWVEIESVYPEVKAAGLGAGFRGQHNVTIFPPTYTTKRHLKQLLTYGDSKRHVYGLYDEGKVVAVLMHVEGGYASLHIYRAR